jgi:hypothetical protein
MDRDRSSIITVDDPMVASFFERIEPSDRGTGANNNRPALNGARCLTKNEVVSVATPSGKYRSQGKIRSTYSDGSCSARNPLMEWNYIEAIP